MRKPQLAVGILALAAAVLLLVYLGRQPASQRARVGSPLSEGGTVGGMAPPFSLFDIGGNKVSSSQFAGRPTVINFFATWCPPCREEIPGFVEVYNKYRGKGFELVGISFDTDTKEHLPRFVMQNRIGYKILMGDVATANAYGVTPLPATYFVGKDGRIKNIHVGFMDKDDFEREVQKLLQKS